MSFDSKVLYGVFLLEYNKRLQEIIESDVVDDEGNILLSPDLKVKHKQSGYEYTIDHVEGKDDSIKIYLRTPDAPRVQPQLPKEKLLDRSKEILGEQDPEILRGYDFSQEYEESIFVIDREEFEKYYEVS